MFSALKAAALLLAAATVAPAVAAPVPPATTVGRDLFSSGSAVTAIYLFAQAADRSELWEIEVLNSVIFQNYVPADTPGAIESFGTTPGDMLVFELRNRSTGRRFRTGIDSTNIGYLDYQSSDSVARIEAAFGVDITVAESRLESIGDRLLVLGFEDRLLSASDRDFNDLIFAFAGIGAGGPMPEPYPLAVIAAGLVAAGLLRRRFAAAAGVGAAYSPRRRS